MKKILATLIVFALILSSFSLLNSALNVKAQTVETAVLSYNWYIAPANTVLAEYQGDLVVVGEVQNTGTTVLGSIYVVGSAYNSTGQIIAQSEGRAFGITLAVGAKAPFYMDFAPETSTPSLDLSWVPNVTSVTVTVLTAQEPTNTVSTDVVVSSDTLHGIDNAGVYTVTGSVLNVGSNPVSDVVLYGTFYNSTGGVIAIGYMDLGTSLQPSGSTTFTMTPMDNTAALTSQIASFNVTSLGVPVAEATSTPIPTAAPTTQPTSSPSSSPTPTQNSGTMGSIATYAIVIAVVVIIVLIVGLMFLRRRGSSQKVEAQTLPQPPPPPPA